MKFKFIGIGAAGNKAIMHLVNTGVVNEDDTLLINSTNKDIPKEYAGKQIILSKDNSGCGKERATSRALCREMLMSGELDNIFEDNTYDSVLIATSVEGGTGSGSTPYIGRYLKLRKAKNVHIVAFLGFGSDPRGLSNTVEFFKDKDFDYDCDLLTIQNSKFLDSSNRNIQKAEMAANEELAARVKVLTGVELMDSTQNIDTTDMYKVVSTVGYKTIETKFFDNNLVDQSEFDKICKEMIYDSKSLKSEDPGQLRLGVILNMRPESEDAIDYNFSVIKEAYGKPYETFYHKQYDGGKQYIKFISSGMKMPLDEVLRIHKKYEEESAMVNTSDDNFRNELSKLPTDANASRFNMVNESSKIMSEDDFFN